MIAITGTSGWIGRAVCSYFEGHGVSVRKFVRTVREASEQRLDLSETGAEHRWTTALAGCQTLLHCAAHVHQPIEDSRARRLFTEINEQGTARLLECCSAAGVARVVFVSSAAVYNWSRTARPRKEEDPVDPLSAYAASKLVGEELIARYPGEWRIARLATVYGKGDIANFARLAAALRRRRFFLPGEGSACKSVIEIDKAAELLGLLTTEANLSAKIVNLAQPDTPSLAEICTAFAETCGFSPPIRIPQGVARLAARFGDALALVAVRAPLTSNVLHKLTTDSKLDVSRMLSLFPQVGWPSFADSLQKSAKYYVGL